MEFEDEFDQALLFMLQENKANIAKQRETLQRKEVMPLTSLDNVLVQPESEPEHSTVAVIPARPKRVCKIYDVERVVEVQEVVLPERPRAKALKVKPLFGFNEKVLRR